MEPIRALLWAGVWVCVGPGTRADEIPQAENVRWTSLDFKTLLMWTIKPSDYMYSVHFSVDDGEWSECPDCSRMKESVCDLTAHLSPLDGLYHTYIKTEPAVLDYEDLEEYPHTYSPKFNPYRESNISAVEFRLQEVDESTVQLNITDPLTSLHQGGRQLSIRDVLKKDLKYKISYYKSGSTGKRDLISDSSRALVPGLDPGQSYCFMVAAFIPSRPRKTQQGAWSSQLCSEGGRNLASDLSLGAWTGIGFILLVALAILITVLALCCRGNRRHRRLQKTQTSGPV
ncbi:tissue factor-like isoform 1-T8 [Menidia menidia]